MKVIGILETTPARQARTDWWPAASEAVVDRRAATQRAAGSYGSIGCIRLCGGFKYFLFSPLFGEDSHFD